MAEETYGIQLSLRRGEDILVFRGADADEFFTILNGFRQHEDAAEFIDAFELEAEAPPLEPKAKTRKARPAPEPEPEEEPEEDDEYDDDDEPEEKPRARRSPRKKAATRSRR